MSHASNLFFNQLQMGLSNIGKSTLLVQCFDDVHRFVCFAWYEKVYCNVNNISISSNNFKGLATDLKTVPKEMIRQRILRTGDGTHKYSKKNKDAEVAETAINNNNEPVRDTEHFWGWGKVTTELMIQIYSQTFFFVHQATKK